MLGRLVNVAGEELKYGYVYLRQQLSSSKHAALVKVLVNGSPKSGTTWMLMMIGTLPGYRIVGNFNGDLERYHTVKPGDVVHGHDWYTPELRPILESEGIKVILMVRDPRDQLVSRMFHVKRSPKHIWHERFQTLSNDEAIMLCIEGREKLPGTDTMIKLTETWLDGRAEALCLKYEDLLVDPVTHFNRVLDYLGIPNEHGLAKVIVERNRFERLSTGRRFWKDGRRPGQENASSHFRKGIIGDWKNYLNEAHIQRFKEVAGPQLIALGYEQDLNW